MAVYSRVNWVDGVTPISQVNLNIMDAGIEDSNQRVQAIEDGTFQVDADKLQGYQTSFTPTADSIVRRDSNGDIKTRLIRQTYTVANGNGNYFVTQNDIGDVSDNYQRLMSLSAVRDLLASGHSEGGVGTDVNALGGTFKCIRTGSTSANKPESYTTVWNFPAGNNSDFQIASLYSTNNAFYMRGRHDVSGNWHAWEKLITDVDVSDSNQASKIMQRDAWGNAYCNLIRQEYTVANGDGTYFLTQKELGAGTDNYARPMTKDAVKSTLGITAQWIPPNSDLNDYKTEGVFYTSLTADALTIANVPRGVAYSLEVYKHAGVSQIFTCYDTGGTTGQRYHRNYYNNAWSDWRRLLDDRDLTTIAGTYQPKVSTRWVGIADGSGDDCWIDMSDSNPTYHNLGYGGEFSFYSDKALESSLIKAGGIRAEKDVICEGKLVIKADNGTHYAIKFNGQDLYLEEV